MTWLGRFAVFAVDVSIMASRRSADTLDLKRPKHLRSRRGGIACESRLPRRVRRRRLLPRLVYATHFVRRRWIGGYYDRRRERLLIPGGWCLSGESQLSCEHRENEVVDDGQVKFEGTQCAKKAGADGRLGFSLEDISPLPEKLSRQPRDQVEGQARVRAATSSPFGRIRTPSAGKRLNRRASLTSILSTRGYRRHPFREPKQLFTEGAMSPILETGLVVM